MFTGLIAELGTISDVSFIHLLTCSSAVPCVAEAFAHIIKTADVDLYCICFTHF